MTQNTRVEPWLYWFLFPLHRLLLTLYFRRIVIEGREYLPEFGPMVLAPKHYSRWDPVVLGLLSREPLYFMTNANQFAGVQGWFIERLGSFPVDLEHPAVSSLKTAIALLQAGKKLVIFPEGGIVRDRPVRSLRSGLARLVLQAESLSRDRLTLPIIPIALRYDPSASWGATIFIHISPPLYSQTYRQKTDKQTALVLTQVLEDALLKNLVISDQ
jgi:1-acyl-sn-glycerol-3-phosphate acyltransferase